MKLIQYFLAIFVVFCFLQIEAFAQFEAEQEVKSLQINSINIKKSNGAKQKQKIRVETIVDGYLMPAETCKITAPDNKCDINKSYLFVDFVIIKIWEDNTFKDSIIGETKLDRANTGELNTVYLNNNKMGANLNYSITNGISYNDYTWQLRESIANLNQEIPALEEEVAQLQDENTVLNEEKNELEAIVNNLKYEIYQMEAALRNQ